MRASCVEEVALADRVELVDQEIVEARPVEDRHLEEAEFKQRVLLEEDRSFFLRSGINPSVASSLAKTGRWAGFACAAGHDPTI